MLSTTTAKTLILSLLLALCLALGVTLYTPGPAAYAQEEPPAGEDGPDTPTDAEGNPSGDSGKSPGIINPDGQDGADGAPGGLEIIRVPEPGGELGDTPADAQEPVDPDGAEQEESLLQPMAAPPPTSGDNKIDLSAGSLTGNPGAWSETGGVITLESAGPFTLTGTATDTYTVVADSSETVEVTLDGVTIESGGAFSVEAGTTVELWLVGSNVLTATGDPNAGLRVPAGAALTIDAESTEDSLTATGGSDGTNGGAGIGGDRNGDGGAVTIKGGTVTATGGDGGAGIGGGFGGHQTGTVTISGNGDVTATGNFGGAGIGGGIGGSQTGDIIISDNADVTAQGDNGGAGIGGGDSGSQAGPVTIEGGTVTAQGGTGGAGIGGGDRGSQIGDVIISGNADVTAQGGDYGAGIGGGDGGNGGPVTISGGEVEAKGAYGGAGIGGGYNGSQTGTVTISGGTVTATGDNGGAGIGGGDSSSNVGGSGGAVIITGGTITATAGDTSNPGGGAAGIGAGFGSSTHGALRVDGGAQLHLRSGGAGADRSADLQIGECVIEDATGDLTGSYRWLTVDGADIAPAPESFWMTDSDEHEHQIIRADTQVQVTATTAFVRWHHSDNIIDLSDPETSPATFTMPDAWAWIATSNIYATPRSSSSRSGNGGSNVGAAASVLPVAPADQTWTGEPEGLPFTVEGQSPASLLSVAVDGEILSPSLYELREGSVIVTLHADYLKSLSTGEHTLRFQFWNASATATFSAQPAGTGGADAPAQTGTDSGGAVNDNPSTGGPQQGGGAVWPALLCGSLGAAALVRPRPRERRNAA